MPIYLTFLKNKWRSTWNLTLTIPFWLIVSKHHSNKLEVPTKTCSDFAGLFNLAPTIGKTFDGLRHFSAFGFPYRSDLACFREVGCMSISALLLDQYEWKCQLYLGFILYFLQRNFLSNFLLSPTNFNSFAMPTVLEIQLSGMNHYFCLLKRLSHILEYQEQYTDSLTVEIVSCNLSTLLICIWCLLIMKNT